MCSEILLSLCVFVSFACRIMSVYFFQIVLHECDLKNAQITEFYELSNANFDSLTNLGAVPNRLIAMHLTSTSATSDTHH